MRTFEILDEHRNTLADGVEFQDGHTVIRWRGEALSTVVWDNPADASADLEVEGHRIRWHEGPPPTHAEAEILDAWLLPGQHPYHREMKTTVLLQWPALGQGIEHLVREHHRGLLPD